MARFIADVPTGYSPQEVNNILNQFAGFEGFKFVEFRGQQIFKKGSGWFMAPLCLKADAYHGVVHIEAWIQTVLVPGIYLSEMDFTGVYGYASKEMFKDKVEALMASIAAKPPLYANTAPPMVQPMYPQGMPQQTY